MAINRSQQILNTITEARREGKKVFVPSKDIPLLLTIGDLLTVVDNRATFLPSTMGQRRRTTVDIVKPVARSNTMLIRGLSYGTGVNFKGKRGKGPKRIYPLIIKFYSVSYATEPDRKHKLKLPLERGNYIYSEVLRENRHQVELRCQCPDFYFRWYWWDKKDGVLSGRAFPKYKRKTTWWPETNPGHHSGFCKHLMSLVEKLRGLKLLKTR